MEERPKFKEITSYAEFRRYYWYREELKQICKEMGADFSGTKLELNHNIEEYFKGNIIKKRNNKIKKKKQITDVLTLDTKLLDCNFAFNQKFRDFFSEHTGVKNFKFNTDMVATAKKVKQDQDASFTLQDMLDVYEGKKEYAKNDNSSCQWNQILKDFCADKENSKYSQPLKVATILWKEVRNSTREKIYTQKLVEEYKDRIKKYLKEKEN